MKKLIILLILTTLINVVTYAQTKNLGININSIYQEIRPVASADGTTLYFTVEGNPINKYKDGQDIWMSTRDENGNWIKAERLPDYINSQKYNGVYWCSGDGSTLLIRGSYNSADKSTHRGYSIIRKINNGWTLPTPVIVNDYKILSQGTYTGGTLSPDEQVLIMYFSDEKNSDINDLWISKFNTIKGEYSTPIKLSISEVDYDEISPYIAPDGKTLFYSSDKPGGIGGHDIWMVKRLDDTWMNWSTPINIGTPFNTKSWDAYFSIGDKGLMGYVATNNKHSLPSQVGGADIESDTLPEFLRPELPKPIVIKSDTTIIHDTFTVTKIIPCDPLDTMNSEQLTKELNKGKILFDFGSSVLRSDAYRKLDVIAKMMKVNPNMKIELGGHTDAIGIDKRNQSQSEERANSAKNYLIAKGIENFRIQTKGYSNTKSISNNKTDAGRQLNRRVDITVISE
jgi:outer membrane protein OmpA-like peptidoglycan-associated protein